MYKIGELSKLCHVSVKTLQYYEKEGLLFPDEVDTFTGYRYCAPAKIDECNRIMAIKELGFSLDEIKKQLKVTHSSHLLDMIRHKENELIAAKMELENKLKRLGSIKEMIANRDEIIFHPVIKKTDPFPVAYRRSIFHHKEEAYQTMEKMRAPLPPTILGKRNVLINYTYEYTEEDFDIALGIEITGHLPEGGEYDEKILEFEHETAILARNKDESENAYLYIHKYIHENNCQIGGLFYEIFHHDGTMELKVPVVVLSSMKNPRIRDTTIMDYIDDPFVIGRWVFFDLLPSKDFFSTVTRKFHRRKTLKELYFLPGGEPYWCYGWTKGFFNYKLRRLQLPVSSHIRNRTLSICRGLVYPV